MKLASYAHRGRESYGVVVGDGLFDLGSRLAGKANTAIDFIAHGYANSARALWASAAPDFGFDAVHFRQPIVRPGKIVCVGINYKSRPGEDNQTSDPKYPSLFMRVPSAQAAHGQAILRPPESMQFDYEGEIAVIIGKAGRRIAPERALSHIFGFSCFNEGSVRDWMKHGVYNVTAGKNFPQSGGFGPWIASMDEIADPHAMRIAVRVNGETRQDDTTANMIFNFEALIAYISTIMPLEPGDVIASGTPIGAGVRFDPPRWLKPGDVVEVEVSGVGVLRNVVADEAQA